MKQSVDIESVSAGWKSPPVVVIGAGVSGLGAVKCCLEEGLDVICLEKTDYIGGLWRYKEEVVDGVASVMKTTVLNTSKEMSSYSDFPIPSTFSNYMHNREYIKYLDMYADAFDLRRHIYHHYVVNNLTQNDDFATSGQWTVKVTNTQTKMQSSIVASAVMVCTGHHVDPHIPSFPGLSDFKGPVVHSHSYKDHRPYENKRVLVVGTGNSGGDVAVELGPVCPKVYLSSRRGFWIARRFTLRGLPGDAFLNRRFFTGPYALIPRFVIEKLGEKMFEEYCDHELYNVKPDHGLFSHRPILNDHIQSSILCGLVTMKNDIHRFTEDGVIFIGEEDTVYPVDDVILSTGYNVHYPFLSQELMPVNENVVQLYKFIFQPKIQPPTLAVIGLAQPVGSLVPISEIQSRVAVSVFKKTTRLPSVDKMELDVQRVNKQMRNRFGDSRSLTLDVDYSIYMDDIGKLIGVAPNLLKLFITDPVLWFHCYFGSNYPYQYRLNGPHVWPGARQAILTANDRMKAALQTRIKPKKELQKTTKKCCGSKAVLITLLCTAGLLAVIYIHKYPIGSFDCRCLHFISCPRNIK